MKAALGLAIALLMATSAWAAPVQGNYSQRPAAKALLQRLKSHGVNIDAARALLAAAKYQPQIVAKMQKPPEKTLTWAQYRPIFVTPKRARAGARYIAAHQAIFDRVEKKYGVPAQIIAAILGVETHYGRTKGHDRVLDALATLAFDYPPRSAYFTRELGMFIRICLAQKLACRQVRGSYAGAMGVPQFMPSSYRAYAVDGNGDGKRDLWHQPADIIASVAHYLAAHGWRRSGAIAVPARLAKNNAIDRVQASTRETAYRWAALRRLGIRAGNPPAPDTEVGLVELTGPHGPEYWLGLHNFFVITSYNHSPLYAMAVYQLGAEIATMRAPKDTP
jgi:membrane-bound lytic murein transglycosylase B